MYIVIIYVEYLQNKKNIIDVIIFAEMFIKNTLQGGGLEPMSAKLANPREHTTQATQPLEQLVTDKYNLAYLLFHKEYFL